jgi:hypothetical protein
VAETKSLALSTMSFDAGADTRQWWRGRDASRGFSWGGVVAREKKGSMWHQRSLNRG